MHYSTPASKVKKKFNEVIEHLKDGLNLQKAIRHGAYHCLQHTQTFRRSFDIYRLHKVHLIWTLDEAYFTAETLYTTITTTCMQLSGVV